MEIISMYRVVSRVLLVRSLDTFHICITGYNPEKRHIQAQDVEKDIPVTANYWCFVHPFNTNIKVWANNF